MDLSTDPNEPCRLTNGGWCWAHSKACEPDPYAARRAEVFGIPVVVDESMEPGQMKLVDVPFDDGRPFSELSDTGLLWLINRVALHPRGFALSLHFDDNNVATGWSLLGDGTEVWSFAEEDDDLKFDVLKEFLKR